MSEKKEKNHGFRGIFGHSRKNSGGKKKIKNLWWLQLVFLFIFLLGAGMYSWLMMGGVAHKLVGGESYDDGGSSGGLSFFKGALAKRFNSFSDKEDKNLSSSVKKRETPAILRGEEKVMKGGRSGADFAGNSGYDQETGAYAGTDYSGAGNGSSRLTRYERKLKVSKQSGFKMSGQSKAKTADGFSQSDAKVVSVRKNSRNTKRRGERSFGKVSAMNQLKSSEKMGIYAQRDASQDSARIWIAKAFDNTADTEYSLEYDEKMKRQLDRVNPSAIPNYLRDQNINISKELTVKDMGAPDIEEKDAIERDEKYQVAKDMGKGMLNGMFSGLDLGGESPQEQNQNPDDGDDGDQGFGAMSDPDNPPELTDRGAPDDTGFYIDEYGYTHTPGADGMSYVFGDDGAIVGCEDISAGICFMPGAGGCPGDLYFI